MLESQLVGRGVPSFSQNLNKVEQVLPSTRRPSHCTHCDDLIRKSDLRVLAFFWSVPSVSFEGDRTAYALHF